MGFDVTAVMKVRSPAKINLFLKITGKRPDNYHELITLMCPISLHDTISLHFSEKETTVICSHPKIPEDETNLAFRAAADFLRAMNGTEGVKICIDKNIPVAAGMGGGSSNAATVLLGLNQYYGHRFSHDQLMAIGLSIGADVPFFILQKPAIATGIGEKLSPYSGLQPFHVLLIYPGFGVSTAVIYKNFNLGLTNCKQTLKFSHFNNQVFDAEHHLCNDLETVTASLYPDIFTAKKALLNHGAAGAVMSVSGPTVLGLFSESKTARKAFRSIGLKHPEWELFLADMVL